MLQSTAAITLTAVAVGVAAVAAFALRRRAHRGPVGIRWIAEGVAVLAGVGAVAGGVVVLGARFSAFFPAAHLAYLLLVVAAPMLGGAVLLATARRAGSLVAVGIALALIVPAPIGWYATHIAPYDLRVDRPTVALPPARAGHDAIRVGVLADLELTHVDRFARTAVDRLMAEHPDLILLPGDIFDGSTADLRRDGPSVRALLARLHAPGGVYAVGGDADPDLVAADVYRGTGVHLLDDRIVHLRLGDRRVDLGGNGLRWAPPEALAIRQRLGTADPKVVRLLLVHRPDAVLGVAPNWDIDLVVGAHTHGGQIALPVIGPLVTFSALPRSVAAGGVHLVGGHRIYISTGVGVVRKEAPQVRFLTRPSVGVITLR